jgi:transcriptional regulator with XRE-family HTH domain
MADDERWRENLKRARESKGWTLDQLARLTGITKSQISMLEKGKRTFTQKTLTPIVDELGIDFADLFCGCSFNKRKTDPQDFNPHKLRRHLKIINTTRR